MKPKPLALLACLLAIFTTLPAWRTQLFSSFEAYAASRLVLFAVMAGLFYRFARGFDLDLSLGDTSVKTGYGDPLLSLRAMACFIVLLGHGTTIHFAPADLLHQATESRAFWLLLPMPWAGVWIFFTLSGYLMGKGFFTGRYHFSRKGILHFYKNRLLRIVPLYYFAILLVVLFLHPMLLQSATLKYVISLGLFDFENTRPGVVMGLLWSVATEMQFYLTVPFVALFISIAALRIGVFPVAALILTFGLSYRIGAAYFAGDTGPIWLAAIFCPLLGNFDLFALGVLSSWTVQRYRLRWPRVSHGILMSVILYVIAAWCWCKFLSDPANFSYPLRYFAPTVFAVGTCLIIVVFENAVRETTDFLSRRLIDRTQILGTLTFAIYMWHEPIFTSFATLFPTPRTSLDTLMALVAGTAAVILFSWVTWRAVEKPFDDLRQRP